MFDRLLEDFCQFDDFCQAFGPRWEARLLTQGTQSSRYRGPKAGLAESEIMTILVLYHSSHFKNFKTFYEGVVLALLRPAFPKAPCYARFVALTGHVSSLRLPKHRSVFNAFTHIIAAVVAYQINPLPLKPIKAFVP